MKSSHSVSLLWQCLRSQPYERCRSLQDYNLKLRVLDALMLPYYTEGRTNVAGAIENVRFMLTPQRGDRPNVPVSCSTPPYAVIL